MGGPLLSLSQRKGWKKCRSLQSNYFIPPFWVTNGTVRLKVIENGRVHIITHLSDLKELLPESKLLNEEY